MPWLRKIDFAGVAILRAWLFGSLPAFPFRKILRRKHES